VLLCIAVSSQALAGQPAQIRAIGQATSASTVEGRMPSAQASKATLIRSVSATRDLVLATDRPSAPVGSQPRRSVAPAADDPIASALRDEILARQPASPNDDVMQVALNARLDDLRKPAPAAAPPAPAPAVTAASATPRPILTQYTQPRVTPQPARRLYPLTTYQEQIRRASRTHGVDEALVRAVIHAESSYKPRAMSHVGAGGLMQLMPKTAARFGVTDRFDPSQNIDGGTKYLAWLLDRYDGNVLLATAAYNAGEGAVDRYRGVPPYRETRGYVQKVASLLNQYRRALVGDFSGSFATGSLSFASVPAYAKGVRAISSGN